MITTQLRVPTEKFEAATGWQLKPEGACKGEMCVPLPSDAFTVMDGDDARLVSVPPDVDFSWACHVCVPVELDAVAPDPPDDLSP